MRFSEVEDNACQYSFLCVSACYFIRICFGMKACGKSCFGGYCFSCYFFVVVAFSLLCLLLLGGICQFALRELKLEL